MGSRLRGNDGLQASDLKTVDPAQAGSYAELNEAAARKKATGIAAVAFLYRCSMIGIDTGV
jgi:hypothetical protein